MHNYYSYIYITYYVPGGSCTVSVLIYMYMHVHVYMYMEYVHVVFYHDGMICVDLDYISMVWGESEVTLLCPPRGAEPFIAIPELVDKVPIHTHTCTTRAIYMYMYVYIHVQVQCMYMYMFL